MYHGEPGTVWLRISDIFWLNGIEFGEYLLYDEPVSVSVGFTNNGYNAIADDMIAREDRMKRIAKLGGA